MKKIILIFLMLLSNEAKAQLTQQERLIFIQNNVYQTIRMIKKLTGREVLDKGVRLYCYHRCLSVNYSFALYSQINFENKDNVFKILYDSDKNSTNNYCKDTCGEPDDERIINNLYKTV